ncbi:MAG TPA: alkaline phosphatase family protein [Blastocatellia bacterium]|nr:alkaline phosphatase family protein [Blastocatellia bacterium]
MTARKLLLVELNEVTWDLIDPLIEQGKLPTFARLKREGVWAAPMSVDMPPHLDPWITWTTVYTGRTQEDHNVFFLEQPPETIRAERIWELCHRRGLRVGVYGSLCSWPPRKVNGFYVPDTFAQDTATYPSSLEPIQELNLTYTRSIRLPADHDSLWFKAQLAARLLALGLGARAAARIARQLATERANPEARWRRVALQPMVNCDFFSRLYRRHRPHFATFHTNHVAHYMHTYWKAMAPEAFPQTTTGDEIRIYGGAIEFGYAAADELLSRMLRLLDRETTLVVASSMGQKPYISPLSNGKPISQLRSLDRLMEIVGLNGRLHALPTMSDQFNLYPDTPATCAQAAKILEAAYVDEPGRAMFDIHSVEDCLTVNLKFYEETTEASRCVFPHREADHTFLYSDLVYGTGLVKSGCHDPKGMMILYGPGVRSGCSIAEANNLDIAPTLLTLMGLPVPEAMKGRVLSEAFA